MKLPAVLLAASLAGAASASRSGANVPRRLSFQEIAGYRPGSQATDHCAIDLDQSAMEAQLAIQTPESFDRARQIYNRGGNSRSYARLALATGLPSAIPKGAPVVGRGADGNEVRGTAAADHVEGYSKLKVYYDASDVQESHVDCRVGALPESEVVAGGCFAAAGDLTVGGEEHAYAYDPATDNRNGRTIASFSTSAREKMRTGCSGCPYTDFMYFYNYYGVDDYAHQFVEAAFEGTDTRFANGNADFSTYGLVGREEAVEGGTVMLHIFMRVIRQLEDALDDCERGDGDSVRAWDEGVCYYAGSLEGRDGLSDGRLLHQLADKRCVNFKTCGAEGADLMGTAKVNLDVFDRLAVGQFHLVNGNCPEARPAVRDIAAKMYVPLIQGALRYAYRLDRFRGGEKEGAEATVHAAALLPRIHAAAPDAARTIYDNLRVGAPSTDFRAVKEALERVYYAIGVSCADVGGLWDDASGGYYADAEPCVDWEQPGATPGQDDNPDTSSPTSAAPSTGKPSLPTDPIPEEPTSSPSAVTTTGKPSNSTIADIAENPANNATIPPSKAPSPSTLSPVASPGLTPEESAAPTDDLSLDLDDSSVGKAGGALFPASALACFLLSYQM